MESEKEDVEKRESKGMRFTVLLILWLIINMIWATLHQQPSLNQINLPDHPLHENHTVEVPNVIAFGRDVHFELRCDFEMVDGISGVVSAAEIPVSITLTSDSGKPIYSWQGTAADFCVGWKGELSPGEYLLRTTISSDSMLVDATVEYDIFVFKNFVLEGFVIANLLGGILASTELPAKAKERKRKKRERRKEKWKPKAWDITAATREVDVDEIGDIFGDTNPYLSDEIEKQRGYYEDIDDGRLDDSKSIPSAPPIEQPDELGKGDSRGLKGELHPDERIKKVSDIYDLMDDET